MASAHAIEDVSSLPGETVHDQEGRKLGDVKDIYGVGDGTPMWVTVQTPTGIGRHRKVFIPLARLKHEHDELRTPYSLQRLQDSPEIESDELSEEEDRTLRSYYGIGSGDSEMVGSGRSYASQLPDDHGPARKIEASDAEGMVRDLDERSTAERAEEAEAGRDDGEEEKEERNATADPLDADKREDE